MSFSKSERKVVSRITPVKITGERRNTTEIETTVKTTLHSAWTPKGGVLNNQLFEERKCLIGHWFENWTDVQRRHFLEHLVSKFNKMSVYFIHNKIKHRIEAPPSDFTRGLPRYLSFKIFQFLDPRTLAQASLVCWHWKWLCEHDVVWKPKCLRRGWDYGKPEPPYERAVWKRFYQQKVWDLLHPPPLPIHSNLYNSNTADSNFLNVTEEDGFLNTSTESGMSRRSSNGGMGGSGGGGMGSGGRKKSSGRQQKNKTYKLGEVPQMNVGYLKHKQEELPPWRSSDNKPRDIELFNKQILGINSENVPRHISEKFTKVEIPRSSSSPRCTSPTPRTRSVDQNRRSRETPSPSNGLKSKSLIRERTSVSPTAGLLKSNSSVDMSKSDAKTTPVLRRHATNPSSISKHRNQQGPMNRKTGMEATKTMSKVAPSRKKSAPAKVLHKHIDNDETVDIPNAWGTKGYSHAAKKVASTDTLGSDAAFDIDSNESLSLYGDDSGKLNGEAWELQSNLSDQ